jgi:prepilin-type N-terminal cleavage/methylation domain-containing protein
VATGFTLLEIVVVLIVLGLSAALVAPALLSPRRDAPLSLGAVIAHVQDMAARRAETLVLEVSPGGAWTAFGTASPTERSLAAGEMDAPAPGRGFSLRIDPLGSCGQPLEADTLGWRPPVDPLTCRPLSR